MPLRVLHLEDDPRDQELVRAMLAGASLACVVVPVSARATYQEALAGEAFDLILADYQLPSFDGIAALEFAIQICPLPAAHLLAGPEGVADQADAPAA